MFREPVGLEDALRGVELNGTFVFALRVLVIAVKKLVAEFLGVAPGVEAVPYLFVNGVVLDIEAREHDQRQRLHR